MKDDLKKIFGMENRTKYFSHVLIYLFLASVVLFWLTIAANASVDKKERAERPKADPFRQVSLQAKSAVVWDVVNKRELFAKSPDMPLPLASLTKVMTAVTAAENVPDTEKVVITPEDLQPEGDSNLVVGDVWEADDLRDFTLLTSSNDGALALAAVSETKKHPSQEGGYFTASRDDFLAEMNRTASQIGLSNSKFFNEHGLDLESQTGGAYGSAMDMALLFEYVLRNRPDILEATRYKNLEFTSAEKRYSAENTNTYIDKIPNVIASKTGYTDLAGGNLVVAFDAGLGRPIIISVLGSTEEGRFTDVLQLAEASLKYISN